MPERPIATVRRPYVGRHRGRHRAPVVRSSRGLTLPGAAAAALTLTATGAAVFPGLSGGTAVADTTPRSDPQQRSTAGSDIKHIPSVRAGVRQNDLVEQATLRRAEARARASRAAARTQLLAKQQAAHTWVLPLTTYQFSSPFGMRWGNLHPGDDLAAPIGTPLVAMSTGTVVFAGTESGYGTKLEIRYWDGTVSWYAHMSRIDVATGDEVKPGQVVGAVGDTGFSTGPHLHLEIHPDGGGPVDPRPWLADHGLNV